MGGSFHGYVKLPEGKPWPCLGIMVQAKALKGEKAMIVTPLFEALEDACFC
jgi:hypothetical protein